MGGPFLFVSPAEPEPANPPKFMASCQSLYVPSMFIADSLLVQSSEGSTLEPSVGNIFSSLDDVTGDYYLELAIELPDTLVGTDNSGDWTHAVTLREHGAVQCYLSNNMMALNCMDKGRGKVVLCRNSHLQNLSDTLRFTSSTAPQKLHTVAAIVSGPISADTAAEAVNSHLPAMRSKLISAVSKISVAHLGINTRASRNTHPIYTESTFNKAFLQIFKLKVNDDGSRTGRLNGVTVWVNPTRSPLQAKSLSDTDRQSIEDFLSTLDAEFSPQHTLGLAHSCFSSGIYDLAFMLAFIYAEVVVSNAFRESCYDHGVSRSKYDDNKKAITMSLVTNVLSYVAFDPPLPGNLTGELNWARKLRNDFVHSGGVLLGRREANRLLKACDRLQEWDSKRK